MFTICRHRSSGFIGWSNRKKSQGMSKAPFSQVCTSLAIVPRLRSSTYLDFGTGRPVFKHDVFEFYCGHSKRGESSALWQGKSEKRCMSFNVLSEEKEGRGGHDRENQYTQCRGRFLLSNGAHKMTKECRRFHLDAQPHAPSTITLTISVDDSMLVHVGDGTQQLARDVGGILF